MTNLLKTASDWLQDRQKTHAATLIVYSRGGHQIALTATVGRTEFEIDTGDGFPVRLESRDFLIHAADLVLGGVTVLPERHDRIRETDPAGDTVVYEVMGPTEDSPPWRYSDSFRRRLRVHTKEVDKEESV